MFTLTSSEQREDGRLTKQFLRLCTIDISAGVAWLLRLLESGAMVEGWQDKAEEGASVKLQQFSSGVHSHVRHESLGSSRYLNCGWCGLWLENACRVHDRFSVWARRVETRHPHCKFPPSEYCPSSLRQPTSTNFKTPRRRNILLKSRVWKTSNLPLQFFIFFNSTFRP